LGSLWDACALTIGFQKLPEYNQQLVCLSILNSIRYSNEQEVADLLTAGKFIKKYDLKLQEILF
jgi:hypothetical protein